MRQAGCKPGPVNLNHEARMEWPENMKWLGLDAQLPPYPPRTMSARELKDALAGLPPELAASRDRVVRDYRDAPLPSGVRDTEVRVDREAPTHTEAVFDPVTFPEIVEWVIGIARERRLGALAGSGHSGLLVAGAAAYVLHIPVIAVRKRDERPKGDGRMVNGIVPHQPFTYGFIDDFIASGETLTRVFEETVRKFPQARMTDLLLYRVQADAADQAPDAYSYVMEVRRTAERLLGQGVGAALMIHGNPRVR